MRIYVLPFPSSSPRRHSTFCTRSWLSSSTWFQFFIISYTFTRQVFISLSLSGTISHHHRSSNNLCSVLHLKYNTVTCCSDCWAYYQWIITNYRARILVMWLSTCLTVNSRRCCCYCRRLVFQLNTITLFKILHV